MDLALWFARENPRWGYDRIQPTVFDGVNDTMSITTDEIFGPVLSVLRFRNLDDALRQANDTMHSLAASWDSADSTRT